MNPLARRDGLVVRDLADETIVYDRESHQAHCLNRMAGIVLQHCDGTRSPEEIAALLNEGDDPAAREAIVKLALEQLTAARLLVEADGQRGVPALGRDDGVASRRELLRLAALAAPMIVSIVAPTPAQAASGCVSGLACSDADNYCDPCDPGGGSNCSDGYTCNPGNDGCELGPHLGC